MRQFQQVLFLFQSRDGSHGSSFAFFSGSLKIWGCYNSKSRIMGIFSDTQFCIKYLIFPDPPPNIPKTLQFQGLLSQCVLRMVSQTQEEPWAILSQTPQGSDENTYCQLNCRQEDAFFSGILVSNLPRPLMHVDSAFFSPESLIFGFYSDKIQSISLTSFKTH